MASCLFLADSYALAIANVMTSPTEGLRAQKCQGLRCPEYLRVRALLPTVIQHGTCFLISEDS